MTNTRKKNLIVSYKNLSKEVQKLFAETYPEGYEDFLQRIVKPNGDTIYTVPLETDDTFYMVKFDVRVDSGMVEEDNDPYDSDDKNSDDSELTPLSEALDKEEGVSSQGVGPLRHSQNYEDFLSEMEEKNTKKKKKKRSEDDDEFDFDNEDDDDFDNDDMDDDEFDRDFDDEPEGPSDDELAMLDMSMDELIGDVNEVPTAASLLAEGKKKTAAKTKAETPATKKSRTTKVSVTTDEPKKATTTKRPRKKKEE